MTCHFIGLLDMTWPYGHDKRSIFSGIALLHILVKEKPVRGAGYGIQSQRGDDGLWGSCGPYLDWNRNTSSEPKPDQTNS